MADKERVKNVRRSIKKSKRYIKLRTAFEDLPQYSLPLDAWRKELKLNHSLREVSKLDPTHPNFGKKLQIAVVREQSTRSRCAEMLVSCTLVKKSLSKTLKHFEDWVLMEYAMELKVYSTVKERQRLVELIIRPFKVYLENAEEVADELKIYIEDIDKAGYVVKSLVDTWTVITQNEAKTGVR